MDRAELSWDGGNTWQKMDQTGNKFSLLLPTLDDANYQVIARAYDTVGMMGTSSTKTLVVDTIPPMIGGAQYGFESKIIHPSSTGMVDLAANTQSQLVVSMKGGVTTATISDGLQFFPFTQIVGTNLWLTNLNFKTFGPRQLTLTARDGADNQTTREIETVMVHEPGRIIRQTDGQPIANSSVTLYYYQAKTKQWRIWDGAAFGEQNPQTTEKDGTFNFMVPAGRYYLEIDAPGYKKLLSQIVDWDETTIINPVFKLQSVPSFSLTLPYWGKMLVSLPTIVPDSSPLILATETIPKQQNRKTLYPGTVSPNLTLSDINGGEISLSAFRGQRLWLTVFAPWSAESQEQASVLSASAKNLPNGTKMLGVGLQTTGPEMQTFIKRGSYDFPIVIDPIGEMASLYGITLLPTHYFLDSRGVVVEVYVGMLSQSQAFNKLATMP